MAAQFLQNLHWRLRGKWLVFPRISAVLSPVLFIVSLSLALTACGGNDGRENAGSRAVIQLATWGSEPEIAVLREMLGEFEREHPRIHVKLVHIPENYYQKLHILVAGDMTPDVVFTNSISFPVYASQNVFLDLRPFLAASGHSPGVESLEKAFYPSAMAAFTWRQPDGKVLLGALPRDISDLVVFYNQDRFRETGVSFPRPGWRWEEFLETAKALTTDQNHDGDPERFGVSFYATPPLFWLPFVWSADGELFSPDLRHISLDRPEAIRGLRFYAALRNRWHVAPRKTEIGGVTMSQWFLQQRLGMMISGRWSVPVLRQQARFHWDVAPLPVGPSGYSRVGIDASGYAIAARSRYPRQSFELIRFLLSRHAIEKVTASGLIVPARMDVAQSPMFLTGRPAHGKAFLGAIPDGRPTRTPPRWNEIAEELGLALEPVWDGKQDASAAIQAVKPRLEQMLETGP